MRELRWKATLLTDRNRLLDAVDDSRCLVAHMRNVNASEAGGDFRKLGDFIRRGKGSRDIEQSGTQTERAVFHSLLDQDTHLREFFGGRFTVRLADNCGADRALANHRANVDRLLQGIEPGE